MKHRIFAIFCASMLALSLTSCAVKPAETEAPSTTAPTATALDIPEDGIFHAEIDIANYGVIKMDLDHNVAPISVENFVGLANSGFYDGLTFHRIINGFMMQGGCPLGTGLGNSGTTIKGEFAENGVENSLSHVRGAVSMARSQVKDSASSQFFIVHQDSTFLDGQYATFGNVTEGMDIVDAICEGAKVEDNNGSVAPGNQPVINSIKIVE